MFGHYDFEISSLILALMFKAPIFCSFSYIEIGGKFTSKGEGSLISIYTPKLLFVECEDVVRIC